MAEWSFLTNHARAQLSIAQDPGIASIPTACGPILPSSHSPNIRNVIDPWLGYWNDNLTPSIRESTADGIFSKDREFNRSIQLAINF